MQSLCKMYVKPQGDSFLRRKEYMDRYAGIHCRHADKGDLHPMIYYVEDDDNIRELVVYTLTQMSLPCRGFADGAAFRAAVAEAAPDLVLLDIMLPDIDGYEVCRNIRLESMVPIIFLSAKYA